MSRQHRIMRVVPRADKPCALCIVGRTGLHQQLEVMGSMHVML